MNVLGDVGAVIEVKEFMMCYGCIEQQDGGYEQCA